ncbi:hypothetical protein ACFXGA_10015 [Actinosynnema sp. NPDC059335]|uniref:hypothetical protein n=1 Tax=Actinosynnema sp. NPDC059335 TaxID=3346804 RepID=UPI003671EAFE
MRPRAAVLLPLVTALLAVLPVPAATAAPGDLTCEVQVQTDFTPPITGSVTGYAGEVSGSFVNCVSATGQTMQSGVFQGTATATSTIATPCSVVIRIVATGTISWTPTASSDFVYVFNTDPAQGLVELSMTITGGALAGDGMIPVAWFTPNLDCALTGLRYVSVGGAGTFA